MPSENAAATPIGTPGVADFLGKSIEAICPFGFGKAGDDQNHCAHFVGHALRWAAGVGLTCDGLLPAKLPSSHAMYGQRGALVRVNQLFTHVAGKTVLDTTAKYPDIQKGLIFVSLTSNFTNDFTEMGNHPRKHVGIVIANEVFHYGNTQDAVRKDSLTQFVKRMTGAYGGVVTFVTTGLPASAGV
ncbi:hypothetical protein [Falsiroseomonas selenitidurans]|uniref:Uncharacterized protein n=1 Tax=Falsiroseomonas selenitidurans TaxID=2716335 RepID=A0ABX1ECF7_9PROT|nr:hypothetical protein [Falsiroseomonas selenitidurans]NKC34558.1 hypothetical protein [Falsiroseomonas selenitidurans]